MLERHAMHWLQLTYKVPREPSQKRVWVWRRLQNLGAYALQNSVYLLPYSEEVEKHFRQLVHESHEMCGEASIFSVVAVDVADEQRILQTLLETRNSEYNTIVKVCGHFLLNAQHAIPMLNLIRMPAYSLRFQCGHEIPCSRVAKKVSHRVRIDIAPFPTFNGPKEQVSQSRRFVTDFGGWFRLFRW